MRRMTHKAMVALDKAHRQSFIDGGCAGSTRFCDEHDTPAEIHLPLGEVMNEKIGGFMWAWKMKGLLTPVDITGKEGFNAQGLEGKVVIPNTLIGALIVWRECPAHRCTIYA